MSELHAELARLLWLDGSDLDSTDPRKESTAMMDGMNDHLSALTGSQSHD